jgi:NAD(P)-dependent dehydrogenase (short-subunit alcohol dehydrogenase family)
VHLTQLCLPYLERSKGNVVSVSSFFSERHGLGAIYLNMLKAALDHWTRGMAMKWGPKGVRFNCIK